MRDLSELLTLPYLAAFDISGAPSTRETSRNSKRVTYIGLTKVVMPMLLDLFLRFKEDDIIYSDTTLETVLSVSFRLTSIQVKSALTIEIRRSLYL